MNNILAMFSPRKASRDREVAPASSPLGPKSALSSKKLRRMTMPEGKIKRSDTSSDATTPTKSPRRRGTQGAATPGSSKKSPVRKSPRAEKGDQDEGAEDDLYSFRSFGDHRWNGDVIEIEVQWEGGDTTWEEEALLHEDAPDALLEYWAKQGGRPANPTDPDLFNILAIRKHSKDRKKLLVEWVGFGPEEASWVPRAMVEETAPEMMAAYWKTVKPAGRSKQKRRRRA